MRGIDGHELAGIYMVAIFDGGDDTDFVSTWSLGSHYTAMAAGLLQLTAARQSAEEEAEETEDEEDE